MVIALKLLSCRDLASIPGRVFAFITVRRTTVVRLTVIKAKTRPGIEASRD